MKAFAIKKKKKILGRVQRRAFLIRIPRSSTLKKNIRPGAGSQYKNEEEWPKVHKKSVGEESEAAFCSEGSEPGTRTVSCREQGRTHSIGPVIRGLKTCSTDLRRRDTEASDGASPPVAVPSAVGPRVRQEGGQEGFRGFSIW